MRHLGPLIAQQIQGWGQDDDDRIVPTEQSVRLAEALPNAELVVVAACGHVPHEECPQAVIDAITAFLAELP